MLPLDDEPGAGPSSIPRARRRPNVLIAGALGLIFLVGLATAVAAAQQPIYS